MSKHYTSGKNIIDIYTFMRMSGLECKRKKNIRVSHKIMEKKMNLRHESFPEQIILPKRVSFDNYLNEDVLRGDILEVVDDYNRVIAYRNPLKLKEDQLLTVLINTADRRSLERIRKAILKEQGYLIESNGDIISKEEYQENMEEDTLEITEKHNRCRRLKQRGTRSFFRK